MTSAYLTRQCERWTRPAAHLFVRPDWRRFVPRDADDHPFALYERKYRPDQPRVAAGGPAGGQWTSDGGAGPTDNGEDRPHENKPSKVDVAGGVTFVCTVGVRILYGDGTHKVRYDCANGISIWREGPGHRFPGIIIQR